MLDHMVVPSFYGTDETFLTLWTTGRCCIRLYPNSLRSKPRDVTFEKAPQVIPRWTVYRKQGSILHMYTRVHAYFLWINLSIRKINTDSLIRSTNIW